MTDLTPIYNALNWPKELRPHKLNAVPPHQPKSIAVDCSCKDWAREILGTDQQARDTIHAEHRAHVEAVTR